MAEKDSSKEKVIEFNTSLKKPRNIEQVLPWPPSAGLMKEMEDGKVLSAIFEVPIVIKTGGGNDKSQEQVLKELANRQKL